MATLQIAPSPLPGYQGPVTGDPSQGFVRARQIFEDVQDIPIRAAQRKATAETAKLQASSAQFENDLLARGATPFDVVYAKSYVQQFGPLPVDATGATDWAELRRRGELIRQQRERTVQRESELAGHKWLGVQTLEDDKGLPSKYAMFQKADGKVETEYLGPDPAAITARERVKTAPATTKVQNEARTALIQKQNLRKQLASAKQTVQEPGAVTGPFIGSPIVRFATNIGAALGIEKAQNLRNKQEALRWLVSNFTLNNVKKLTGALSEKELKFLENSVPTLGTSEENWLRFLTEYDRVLSEEEADLQSKISSTQEAPAEEEPAPSESFPPGVGRDRYIRSRKTGKLYLQKADGTITEVSAPATAPAPAPTGVSETPIRPAGPSGGAFSLEAPTIR